MHLQRDSYVKWGPWIYDLTTRVHCSYQLSNQASWELTMFRSCYNRKGKIKRGGINEWNGQICELWLKHFCLATLADKIFHQRFTYVAILYIHSYLAIINCLIFRLEALVELG